MDVTNKEDIQNGVRRIEQDHGKLHILVNKSVTLSRATL